MKQVIVIRKDLHMTKGKMIAQGAHASLGVVLEMMKSKNNNSKSEEYIINNNSNLDKWLKANYKKICVYVNSEYELLEIYKDALKKELPVKLIIDDGLTMFKGTKTKTCLAIGPSEGNKIDEVTGGLNLL